MKKMALDLKVGLRQHNRRYMTNIQYIFGKLERCNILQSIEGDYQTVTGLT